MRTWGALAWGWRGLRDAFGRASPVTLAVLALGAGTLLGSLLRCAPVPPPARQAVHVERAAVVEHAAAVVHTDTSRTEAVHRRVTRTEVRPDGTRTVTREDETRGVEVHAAARVATRAERAAALERVDVERVAPAVPAPAPPPAWRVTLAAGWDVLQPAPSVYRAAVTRRLVGPVSLGAWAEWHVTRAAPAGGVLLALELP